MSYPVALLKSVHRPYCCVVQRRSGHNSRNAQQSTYRKVHDEKSAQDICCCGRSESGSKAAIWWSLHRFGLHLKLRPTNRPKTCKQIAVDFWTISPHDSRGSMSDRSPQMPRLIFGESTPPVLHGESYALRATGASDACSFGHG